MKKITILFLFIFGFNIFCFAQKSEKIEIKFQIDSNNTETGNVYANIILRNLTYKSQKCFIDEGYNNKDIFFKIRDSIVNDTLILPLFHFKLEYLDIRGCDSSTISYSYTNMNILKLKGKKKYYIKIVLNKEQLSSAKYIKVILNLREGLSYGRPQVATFKLLK